jgi:hypothetical protein
VDFDFEPPDWFVLLRPPFAVFPGRDDLSQKNPSSLVCSTSSSLIDRWGQKGGGGGQAMGHSQSRGGSSGEICDSNTLLFEVDSNGVLTAWNGACEAVFDLSASEVLGRSLFSTIPLEDSSQVKFQLILAHKAP